VAERWQSVGRIAIRHSGFKDRAEGMVRPRESQDGGSRSALRALFLIYNDGPLQPPPARASSA
jgi:hypothetical protein